MTDSDRVASDQEIAEFVRKNCRQCVGGAPYCGDAVTFLDAAGDGWCEKHQSVADTIRIRPKPRKIASVELLDAIERRLTYAKETSAMLDKRVDHVLQALDDARVGLVDPEETQ